MLALPGATISTYFLSTLFRKGKTSIGDMANAALPGILIKITGTTRLAYEDSEEFGGIQ